MELIKNYKSLRWSNEVLDCSMPMTFDTYSKCSYHCLYCFAFYQKLYSMSDYLDVKEIRAVDPQKVIRLFERAMQNDLENANTSEKTFFSYIQARRIMQWGGMADAFDEWERRFGITLELLRYFDSIDYPLSFSTKAAWWTKDERYMKLFRKHAHNWHVKVSIITTDKVKSRAMEKGCPSPEQRLAAIKNLANAGIHVTLRLRPYIIGVSGDWKELIAKAKQAGADSVTVEFFCMEARASEKLKSRYAEMSRICGYDIWEFYMHYSKQQGYKRLSRAIKAPIIYEMRDYAHGLGMRFHVSDAYCRECNDACNCCGVPPEWNVSQRGHIGEAILIAREKGFVRFSDIAEPAEKFLDKINWREAPGYNCSDTRIRALNYGVTMFEFVRNNWNRLNAGTSPSKGYGGILIPCGVDENGDVIYKYNAKLANK